MGQAKQRGSFEQRQAAAMAKEEEDAGSFLSKTQEPVDLDTFLFVFHAAVAAAAMQTPGVDPTKKKFRIEMEDGEFETFSFTNTPLNRGISAAVDHLHGIGVESAPYVARLMHVFEVFKSDKFSDFIKPNPEASDSSILVSDALLKAMAMARFVVNMEIKQMGFDLEDVLAKTLEFAALDDADDPA